MRPDQFQRLEALQEKLVDTLMDEANPENWAGGDKKLEKLTREERGDRYWCKKNAAATLTLITKTLALEHFRSKGVPEGEATSEDDGLDKEIDSAERKAAKLLEAYQAKQVGNA